MLGRGAVRSNGLAGPAQLRLETGRGRLGGTLGHAPGPALGGGGLKRACTTAALPPQLPPRTAAWPGA